MRRQGFFFRLGKGFAWQKFSLLLPASLHSVTFSGTGMWTDNLIIIQLLKLEKTKEITGCFQCNCFFPYNAQCSVSKSSNKELSSQHLLKKIDKNWVKVFFLNVHSGWSSVEWKLLCLIEAVNLQYSQNEFLVTMWSTGVEYRVTLPWLTILKEAKIHN